MWKCRVFFPKVTRPVLNWCVYSCYSKSTSLIHVQYFGYLISTIQCVHCLLEPVNELDLPLCQTLFDHHQ